MHSPPNSLTGGLSRWCMYLVVCDAVLGNKYNNNNKFEENRSSHFRDTSEQNFVSISWFFFFFILILHTSQNLP